MNRVELKQEQIDQLFQFVASKYVRYVDVQHELVDHLASAIEDEMAKDCSLSFEAALNIVYGRFPVTGFTNFVTSKEREMRRYWSLRAFNYFKRFLTMPRCILTVMIFVAVSYINRVYGLIPLMAVGYTLLMVVTYLDYKRQVQFVDSNEGSFLFYSGLTISSQFPFLILLVLQTICTFITINTEVYYLPQSLFTDLYFTYLMIWCYANIVVFPKMLEEEIKTKYRHIVVS